MQISVVKTPYAPWLSKHLTSWLSKHVTHLSNLSNLHISGNKTPWTSQLSERTFHWLLLGTHLSLVADFIGASPQPLGLCGRCPLCVWELFSMFVVGGFCVCADVLNVCGACPPSSCVCGRCSQYLCQMFSVFVAHVLRICVFMPGVLRVCGTFLCLCVAANVFCVCALYVSQMFPEFDTCPLCFFWVQMLFVFVPGVLSI